jgi:hypothetical protein
MSCNPSTAVTRRTRNVHVWTAHDDRRQEWLAEVIVRRPTGILHLVNRYPGQRPTRRVLYRDACRHGHFSPRPYQLAQACDGSITGCVLALFGAFCEARRLDPNALLRRAYADEEGFTEQDFAEIRRNADWERTAYPAKWDGPAIEGLLESLHEVNYHQLAGVVEDLIENESS